jgi:hypothetical protein
MRWRHVFVGLGLAALLAAGNGRAFAQGLSITITVDENGNGTFTNSNGFFSGLPASVQPDPGPGGLSAVLTYGLLNPPGLTAGDLVLVEPGLTGAISDVVRFNPNETVAGSTGALAFYSDASDGHDALADVGFPGALYANTVTFVEVGPEGNNGFTYTPTAGQPGFVAGAAGAVTYVIRSDVPASVPEPGPLVLGSVAASVGLATLWARRRRAAA